MRGTLYARVSTDDKGHDPDVQLQPMRELAAARGWVWTEYVDRLGFRPSWTPGVAAPSR